MSSPQGCPTFSGSARHADHGAPARRPARPAARRWGPAWERPGRGTSSPWLRKGTSGRRTEGHRASALPEPQPPLGRPTLSRTPRDVCTVTGRRVARPLPRLRRPVPEAPRTSSDPGPHTAHGHRGCCCEPPHTTARQQEPAGAPETPRVPVPGLLPPPTATGTLAGSRPATARPRPPLLPPLQLGLAGPPGGPFTSRGGGRHCPPAGPAPGHLSGRPISNPIPGGPGSPRGADRGRTASPPQRPEHPHPARSHSPAVPQGSGDTLLTSRGWLSR